MLHLGAHARLRKEKTSGWGAGLPQSGNSSDGLVDEMHLAYTPVLLGFGECLLAGMDLPALGYHVTSHVTTVRVMHVLIAKKNP